MREFFISLNLFMSAILIEYYNTTIMSTTSMLDRSVIRIYYESVIGNMIVYLITDTPAYFCQYNDIQN